MKMSRNRWIIGLVCLASAIAAPAATYDDALRAYKQTDYELAVQKLSAANDSRSLLLLGQSWFMLGEQKKATETLERAVALDPNDSNIYLWLGRAYGRRAETAFPLAAPSYASKARANFEKSVQLDSHNLEAINDLFEYYLAAPGFLGGGVDKAAKLAESIEKNNAAEGSWARARVAMERKQYDTAEAQLRHAVQLAPQQVGRILDLAKFLAKRGKYQESDQIFSQAALLAPQAPKVLYQRASTLIETNRNLPEARLLLEKYLSSSISPDDPSKRDAEKLLKKVSGS